MEMDNSLQASLQHLIMLQQEQINQLRELTANQQRQTSLEQQQLYAQNSKAYFQSPYMNYAPNYMPPMIQMGHNFNQSYNQFQGYMGDVKSSQTKYGFIDSIFSDPNKVSDQTRNQMTIDFGGRVASAAMSGANVAAQGLLGIGSQMFLPGLSLAGSLALGIGGGALIGSYFNNGIDEYKQQNAYTKYLTRESYRFINSGESVNPRDLAGFSLNQSQEVANWLTTNHQNFGLNETEMMTLLQKYTEGNLMKEVSDVKTFKEKFTSLTKAVKTGALLLNETYDSIAQLMSEMRKAGIDQKNYDNIMALGKILGSNTGASASEVVRNLLEAAKGAVSGTGASAEDAIGRYSDTLAYTSKWFSGLKDKGNTRTALEETSYNMINNLGGVTGASVTIGDLQEKLAESSIITNPALAFFNYNANTRQFEFNRQQFNEFISGKGDYEQISRDASLKLSALKESGNQAATEDWEANASLYIKNSLTGSDLTKLISRSVDAYNLSEQIRGNNFNTSQILGFMGISDSSMRTLLGGYLDYHQRVGDSLGNQVKIQSAWEATNMDLRANTLSIRDTIAKGWNDFKDYLASPFLSIGTAFEEGYQAISDKWYGASATFANSYRNLTGITDYSAKNIADLYLKAQNALLGVGDNLRAKGFNVADIPLVKGERAL